MVLGAISRGAKESAINTLPAQYTVPVICLPVDAKFWVLKVGAPVSPPQSGTADLSTLPTRPPTREKNIGYYFMYQRSPCLLGPPKPLTKPTRALLPPTWRARRTTPQKRAFDMAG